MVKKGTLIVCTAARKQLIFPFSVYMMKLKIRSEFFTEKTDFAFIQPNQYPLATLFELADYPLLST